MSTRGEIDRVELLQGTLDLLVLRTLLPGQAHGHAIARNIERNSEDVLQVEQGSLYPALHRLIKRGWIIAEEGTSENNRQPSFIASPRKAENNSPSRPPSGKGWREPLPAFYALPVRREEHELPSPHRRRYRP
jgi:PadR family transcriptional regulator